jgi:hypothetical protein
MARSRNIKPGFFKNEVLADLKPMVRLMFIGLWTLSDRDGRMEDRPARIKAELFPYEQFNAEDGMTALASNGFIQRYECNGHKYIQITNFHKHQNPHVNEQASTIPAPELHHTCTVPVALIPSSLIPSSLIPSSLIPETLSTDAPEFPSVERFDELWKRYPNKDGKRDAFRHFKGTVKSEEGFARIKRALDNYLASTRVKKGFIKNGSTWFNVWTDWENFIEANSPVADADAERIANTQKRWGVV